MLIAYVGILVLGAGTFYLGWNLFSGTLEGQAASRLEQKKKTSSNGLLKLNRPVFRALVLPYSTRMKLTNFKKKWKKLIISAGLEEEIDTDELMAFKINMGFVFPSFFFLYLLSSGAGVPFWMVPVIMGMGYMYPNLWITGNRKRRHEEIRLQMPFVLDLLTLSTEAGLDFIGALQKVVEKTRSGPLVDEVQRMLQQIQLGTTRADSMREFGQRIDLQEIASLVAVLVTADQMGSPLGPVLRVQSDLIRTQRFTNAEKKGAAASQKLLFPLIFFIMPAVFIMIFGPIILSALQ